MNTFRYQAIAVSGAPMDGVIEAEDRRTALLRLGERGLFPSSLEACSPAVDRAAESLPAEASQPALHLGKRVKRKEITAFTREMGALLAAAIPIPQALDGLGEQEENLALRTVILKLSDSVRKGGSFSSALDEHPRLFSKLYASMVRVGEEAGALPGVM